MAAEHHEQEHTRVGFLGPAGTFTEEALLSSALADAVEPVAFATIYDTVMAVRRREVQWAVAPIENSLDGSVTVTLDLLAETGMRANGECHPASVETGMLAERGMRAEGECPPASVDEHGDLEIVGEALLAVRHSLIAAAPVAVGEIDTVITHPQVPGQCTRLLRGELARARVLPASSTAEAVRLVVSGRAHGQAALGTRLAAELYGGGGDPRRRAGPRRQRDPLRVAGASRSPVCGASAARCAGRGRRGVEDARWCSGARARTAPGGWCGVSTSSRGARST